MKYRSWMDIIAMILDETKSGLSKTKIMLNVRLSYYQLEEYLNTCIRSDLLKYDKMTRAYKITEKGKEFCELYYAMNILISNETLPLKIRIVN